MVKHYLKRTIRYIRRNTLVTTINIFGLSVGLACTAVIGLWVQDELNYDRFHENGEDLYLLTIRHPNDVLDPNVPYALAPALASEYPEIASYTRINRIGNVMTCSFKYERDQGDQVMYYEENINLVDPDFFKMFSFPFLHGSQDVALANPNSMVISEEIAGKYFGEEDPVGRRLTFNNRVELEVTGVVHIPKHSHLQLDFLLPLGNPMTNDWNWRDPSYVLLGPNASVSDVKDKIAGGLAAYSPYPNAESFTVDLLPVDEIHLGFGRRMYIYIISVIALLILVIACINYMNLATACASNRAKEIGLSKVVGAKRIQLLFRFLSESLLLSLIAILPSSLFIWGALPAVNDLTSKEMTLSTGNGLIILLSLLGLGVIVGLVSGIYPALYLTSMKPVEMFKSVRSFGRKRSVFRLVSVVGQFTASALLIIVTIIVYQQLQYVQNRPLGLNTSSVVSIRMNDTFRRSFTDVKTELLRNPDIVSVTAGQAVPFDEDYKTSGLEWTGRDPELVPNVRYSIAEVDFLDTFELEILDGRSFSESMVGDRNNFVINETAARYMDMEEPIGKTLEFWGRSGTIIGVVRDFHHVSLHREILPHVITANPSLYGGHKYIFVRIKPTNVPNTVEYLADVSSRFAPDYPFEYTFLNDGLADLYQAEQDMGRLFGYFAGIAIVISCLGVFGLSLFSAEQRTKEIGIRKVFGASITRILLLLFRDFGGLVLVALIVAVPVSIIVMERWLEDFAYRIDIGVGTLVLTGFLIFALTAFTVSYQSIKAATTNPVESLRYE